MPYAYDVVPSGVEYPGLEFLSAQLEWTMLVASAGPRGLDARRPAPC